MRIAIVAPSPVPFTIGGAEKLWWGMLDHINQQTHHQAELIKLPSPENNFSQLISSYKQFSELDLSHFDRIISTKYPAWMVDHPEHYCYLQHKLRGLYDTYHFTQLPEALDIKSYPEEFRELLGLIQARPERSELARLFELVEGLLQVPQFETWLRLPSPLVRAIVHYMDGVAMRPGAIVEFSAISQTVAQRRDYFPPQTKVRVTHHPSDLRGIREGGQEYIFTCSRLDAPKRLDLLIQAYLDTSYPMPLKIAGTGPQEERLRNLAQGDPRIQLLGRVTDTELAGLYADAIFVPFMPYDEDFGLITIEAMSAAKPVLTTQDAGGVTEFVESGITGALVEPTVEGIRLGLDLLLSDLQATAEMGRNARNRVADISWHNTLSPLLSEAVQLGYNLPASPLERRSVVVASTFSVWPPYGGGQARIFNLYKQLAKYHDVTLVCLADKSTTRQLADGLIEVTVARSKAHLKSIDELQQRYGRTDLSDIADIDAVDLTPEYLTALKRESSSADWVIASHPYLYKAIKQVWRGPLGYDSHNVEVDMKGAVLKGQEADDLIARVREVEQACYQEAAFVVACSQADLDRYSSLFTTSQMSMNQAVVPNGVDLAAAASLSHISSQQARERLGLSADEVPILFTGSWHAPNIEALELVYTIAERMPQQIFWVVGSVCHYPELPPRPDNVLLLGVLSDAQKAVVMRSCEIALNPMTSGSGTNLKMLDYAAWGQYIITTEFGNRGIEFVGDAQAAVSPASAEGFVSAIEQALAMGEASRRRVAERARRRVEREFDWSICALGLISLVNSSRESLQAVTPAPD